MAKLDWSGVFPAATTQFAADLSVDISASQRTLDALIRDGVHGLILLGTCGENNSLEPDEKRSLLAAGVEVAAGRVPTDGLCSNGRRAGGPFHGRC
jgi:4-hydroxy-tetrahydrodipicolinate synthase